MLDPLIFLTGISRWHEDIEQPFLENIVLKLKRVNLTRLGEEITPQHEVKLTPDAIRALAIVLCVVVFFLLILDFRIFCLLDNLDKIYNTGEVI